MSLPRASARHRSARGLRAVLVALPGTAGPVGPLSAQQPVPRPRPDSPGADSVAARRRIGRGDTAGVLAPVRVTARVAPRTVTFLPERHGAALLTGEKTEVLLVDSVGANAAQNVARQVRGRAWGSGSARGGACRAASTT